MDARPKGPVLGLERRDLPLLPPGDGLLSLVFAAVIDQKAMLLSYFQNPLIAFLNLAPL